jgi:iron complex transport system ATP-binding protein
MKLKVSNLCFLYDDFEVLKDVSLEVESAQILGIIGPNGSGKTTLLKCINRKLMPRSGIIAIDNIDIHNLSRREIARNIGVVPQISSISFPFFVSDVVLMGRYAYISRFGRETGEDLSIVRHSLELTGTAHLADRYINEISGGEYQRVIIARALAQEPKILLLDEPILHLDINHQIEIMELVRALAKEKNIAVAVVLHDLNLAGRFTDRLVLLNRGKIYQDGPTDKVLSPENIENIFRVKVKMIHDPETDILNIIPISAIRA